MRVKFLAQGNNSKQLYLGIEPGSVGSQADPKPLKPQLPQYAYTGGVNFQHEYVATLLSINNVGDWSKHLFP